MALIGEARGDQLDEAADLGREMAAMRVDGVDRELDGTVLFEQANQPAVPDILGDDEARRQEQAMAGERGIAQRLRTVGQEVAGDPNRQLLAVRTGKAPFVAKGVEGIAQAVMLGEIVRQARRLVGFEIARRAAKNMAPWRQAADD